MAHAPDLALAPEWSARISELPSALLNQQSCYFRRQRCCSKAAFRRHSFMSNLHEDPTIPDLNKVADYQGKSPFIEIKPGTEKPPVFITHGLCGTAQFGGLARQIHTGNPIYGIQGKGVDGIEKPVERVEEMADYYLESLQALYPQGPYILVGYSFGGLVALEMAQRLWGTPNEVALLVLLDAYPHPSCYTRPVRMRLLVTRIRGHLNEMLK